MGLFISLGQNPRSEKGLSVQSCIADNDLFWNSTRVKVNKVGQWGHDILIFLTLMWQTSEKNYKEVSSKWAVSNFNLCPDTVLYQSYPAVFFWPAHQYNTLSVEEYDKLWVETGLSGV